MSYTPTLLVNYDELVKIEDELQQESDFQDSRSADYLLFYIKNKHFCKYGVYNICVIEPELSYLNAEVRERLEESDIYYSIIN